MSIKRSAIPILGLMTVNPMSGYELKQAIDSSLGNFWNESFGQLYPQLRKLNEAGYIQELERDNPSSERQKKTYAITDAGRKELQDWLEQEPVTQVMRDELLLKIFFASECDPSFILDHCRKTRKEAAASLEKYKSIETSLNDAPYAPEKIRYWRMTVRYGIITTRALLDWCDETIADLEGASPDTRQAT